MTHVRTHRLAAILVAGALTMTACGQREGVHVENTGNQALAGSGGGGGGGDSAAGAGDQGGGSLALADDGQPADTGGTGPGVGGGGGQNTTGGGGDGSGGGGGDGSGGGGGDGSGGGGGDGGGGDSGGQFEVTGSDRTGVTDESITVAFHAPVTGAAPLPAKAFEDSKDLYWRWHADKGREFLGRPTVEVLFSDDKYDPANARQICRQLKDDAFIVAGGGGTDQIQACGALAGSERYLYFSAGVTEAGLENDWYFASSMTYKQQGVLLAQYIKQTFPDKKFGVIMTDTENFDDALEGFEEGVAQAGTGDSYGGSLRHSKGDQSWYNQFGNEMANRDVEVLYLLTSPVDYINFAQQNPGRGFQYVGVGVSMGLNAVLRSGCPEVDQGHFFSPFPGLDWMKDNDPTFLQAWQKFEIDDKERSADLDLGFALWGINKSLDVMLQRYQEFFGNDLTREDFRNLVENGGRFENGIFPAVEYGPGNHFGGQAVHVLKAECDKGEDGEYVTEQAFATGF